MNSTVKIAWLLLVLFLSACKEESVIVPSDLIAKDEFVEILVDLNLIEATRSMHASKEQKLETHPSIFYRELWIEHGVKEDQFLRSFEYYRSDLDEMAILYERTAKILKRKEDDVNAAKRAANNGESATQEASE